MCFDCSLDFTYSPKSPLLIIFPILYCRFRGGSLNEDPTMQAGAFSDLSAWESIMEGSYGVKLVKFLNKSGV